MGFGGHGGGGAPAAKVKNFKGSLKRLGAYLAPFRWTLVLIVLLSVVSVSFSIVGPKILGETTNVLFEGLISQQLPEGVTQEQAIEGMRAQGQDQLAEMLSSMTLVPGEGVDFSEIATLLGWLAVVYVLSALFGWWQGYLMAEVAQRTVYRMREAVDQKLARLPLKYFDDNSRGDTLSRVTNDIDNIANTLSQAVTQVLTAALTIIGVLGMMLWISPLLAAISLLVIPISLVVTIFIAKRSQKQFAAQWEKTGTLNGHIEEMFTGHGVVKVFGHQEEAIELFDIENEGLYESSFKAQFISGTIMPTLSFLNNLNYVGVAVIGGLRVANGMLSLGDVQAFIQYSRQFTQPIMQVAGIANRLQSTVASAERVFELLDAAEEDPDIDSPTVLENAKGHVEFTNVSFRYAEDTPLI